MITGFVQGQVLRLSAPVVAADTLDYLTAQFVFRSADWNGMDKWAHFAKGGTVYDIPLTDDKIRREDHLNLGAGEWKVYVHGNRFADGTVVERITTAEDVLRVVPTGALNGEPFPEMPASVTEQILARLENVEQNGGGGSGGGISRETDPTVPDWAKQPKKPTYTAKEVGAATEERVNQLSAEITGKADKTLKSADGDLWEIAVESDGDVVTHKTSGAVEIVAGSLNTATFADKVLTLSGIAGTYGAVIIPDASEISIDVPTNVEKYPYFANPAGWQNPSFGWFLLRTAEGYITVHTTNYAEVYKVSADLKTWTSIGGAIKNVAQNTMRVVLDNGTATVYSDDVVTYSVDGIAGIGYCASSVKVQTIYGMTVIHRRVHTTNSGGDSTGTAGSGLSATEKALMLKLFYNATYSSPEMQETYNRLRNLWSDANDTGGGEGGSGGTEAEITQAGSVLYIVSGVTATKSGTQLILT